MEPTLLIVEDHEAARELIFHALEDQGYRLVFAADAEQAIRELRQQPVTAALVDVSLPGTSGLEVCQQIKSRPELRHVPVILMSGALGARELAAESQRAGADAFLSKPFSLDELRTVLRAFTRIHDQAVEIDELRHEIEQRRAETAAEESSAAVRLDWALPYHEFMKLARKKYFLHALAIAGGNKSRLARTSGLDRSTLYVHFRNLGMLSPQKAPERKSAPPVRPAPRSGARTDS